MTIYRGMAHLIIRAGRWGLAAVLFATLAALSRDRWVPALVGATSAMTFVVLTIRTLRSRIEADSKGITVHDVHRRAFYRWKDITLIGVFQTGRHGRPLRAYIPAARLNNGRHIQLAPATCYRRAMAATIGAQLEAQRRSHL